MKKVFVYPVGNPEKSNAKNPYIFDMLNSISNHYILVNKPNSYTKYGILSVLLNFRKANTFVFNWTENIPDRKLGYLQVTIFFFLVLLIRIRGKEFIWVLHNKKNHKSDNLLSRICMGLSAYFSTKIVTHSTEGIHYLDNTYGSKIRRKAIYIPHPTNLNEYQKIKKISKKANPEYDFIIWGSISKYKGILEFMNFISQNRHWQDKKILICGKSSGSGYLERLKKVSTENTTIIEGYIENDFLNELIMNSKSILFVYTQDSVLSSGALIKSLYYKKPIIGPNVGAFKDLMYDKLVMTYDKFNDILQNIEDLKIDKNKFESFIYKNSWELSILRIID